MLTVKLQTISVVYTERTLSAQKTWYYSPEEFIKWMNELSSEKTTTLDDAMKLANEYGYKVTVRKQESGESK